jgi:hypothetical protein
VVDPAAVAGRHALAAAANGARLLRRRQVPLPERHLHRAQLQRQAQPQRRPIREVPPAMDAARDPILSTGDRRLRQNRKKVIKKTGVTNMGVPQMLRQNRKDTKGRQILRHPTARPRRTDQVLQAMNIAIADWAATAAESVGRQRAVRRTANRARILSAVMTEVTIAATGAVARRAQIGDKIKAACNGVRSEEKAILKMPNPRRAATPSARKSKISSANYLSKITHGN